MNVLAGEIVSFLERDELSLVSVRTALGEFSVLMLNFSQSLGAKKGSKVQLLFKENELNLASATLALKGAKTSAENAFCSRILKLEKGEIFWQVFLECELSALISAKAGKALNVSENDEVACFVKADDIIIKVL